MQKNFDRVVLLGTGGTIAGTAARADDHVGYQAGQLAVTELVAALPELAAVSLEAEQVAQLDSKDMDLATWQRLAQRVSHHLARSEVAGVVVTHGTDTLEETAWFLHRVLAPAKPVVLTAAMRPASARMADGPENLLDAVRLVGMPGVQGVVAMLAQRVHGAADLRKLHGQRVDAFSSGDAGPLALLEDGCLRVLRPWPQGVGLGLERIAAPVADWPKVALLASHGGLDAGLAQAQAEALRAAGCAAAVVEGTGNGTVHQAWLVALADWPDQGRPVWRASRCLAGGVVGQPPGAWPSAGMLSPGQARVELMLQLLACP